MNLSNYSSSIGKLYSFIQKLCGLEALDNKEKAPLTQNDFNSSTIIEKSKLTEQRSCADLQLFELFASIIERVKIRILGRFALADYLQELG